MALNRFVEKHDYPQVFVLLSIALSIGIYLIVTSVLISKDGVYYIERAQLFSSSPIDLIQSHPFGYPFLIFVTHKFVMLFSANASIFTWIYTAQSVTLIFRLAALIPLYFIGKFFVGSRRSFWAILILIILPYPADFGSDVLRGWPHILFLAAGFLLLLWGAKKGKYWMFGAAGLITGLGYMIRPECAQLVIYGTLWIMLRLLFPKNDMSRIKLLCVWFILLIGFAIPVVPYVTIKGRILPLKLKALFSSSDPYQTENVQISEAQSDNNTGATSDLPTRILKAIGTLIGGISDNLMYYFMLPLVIGVYSRFRRTSEVTDIERFFLLVFVLLNVIMLILLYDHWGYISRRHCLPLVVFLVFYVPEGLERLGWWFEEKFSRSPIQTAPQSQRWFFILLVIGVVICMSKLHRLIGTDKPGYRAAASWLKENTDPEDVIAVPDRRISFYAERKGLVYETGVPGDAEYLVRFVKNGDEEADFNGIGSEEYSVSMDNQKQSKKKLLIYKLMK